MRKSVFFDEESQKHLEYLDKKMNLKPNHSAVIRLALQQLYEREINPETHDFRIDQHALEQILGWYHVTQIEGQNTQLDDQIAERLKTAHAQYK